MSYNGIGLITPRGSGTSGYVQRNIAAIKKTAFKLKKSGSLELNTIAVKKPNKKILEHRRKRRIEVLCLQMREKMTKNGHSDEEINKEEKALREKHKNSTLEQLEDGAEETHLVLKAQQERNRKLRSAFGIGEEHKIGDAFRFDEMKQEKEREKANMTAEERLKKKKASFLSRDGDVEREKERRLKIDRRRFYKEGDSNDKEENIKGDGSDKEEMSRRGDGNNDENKEKDDRDEKIKRRRRGEFRDERRRNFRDERRGRHRRDSKDGERNRERHRRRDGERRERDGDRRERDNVKRDEKNKDGRKTDEELEEGELRSSSSKTNSKDDKLGGRWRPPTKRHSPSHNKSSKRRRR